MPSRVLRIVWALALGAATMLPACGGGSGGDDPAACADLGLSACRATAGCEPDVCEGCACESTYRGCIPEGVAPSPCPPVGCPASPACCASSETCDSGRTCSPPGAILGCGACTNEPSSCELDADCAAMGPTSICEPIRCACEGNKACTPGCVDDTTCAEGTRCDLASARCRAIDCVTSDGCPPHFACGSSMICERLPCERDRDCGDGFCVNASCYGDRGTCTSPPP